MLNYPRIAYNKWGNNPFVRWFDSLLSDIQRKTIFRGTPFEPVIFEDHCIELGQATHPDLLYNHDSREFLMTVSNYPYGIERLEDSFVLSSKDGIHFTNLLEGAIEAYGGRGNSHFSDGDLIFDGTCYTLYYRFCERDSDFRDIISISTSSDGKTWGKGRQIINAPRDGLVSPAVIYHDGKYIMYYVALNDSGSALYKCCSETNEFADFFDNRTEIAIENMPSGRMLWHINVSAEGEKLHGLFALSTGAGGANSRLYYAEGDLVDNTWEIKYEIDPIIDAKHIKKVYRSAIVKVENIWYLYMSICTNDDCWYLGRRQFHEIC